MRGVMDDFERPQPESIGISNALAASDDALTLLRRAAENASAAHSPKVEWTVDWNAERPVWFNWTQIIRHPFGFTGTKLASRLYGSIDAWELTKTKALIEHLRDIDKTVTHGSLFRQISYHFDEETGEWYPVETKGMGGAKFYLGREPSSEDHLELKILRDTEFIDRTTTDYDGRQGEYRSEISLLVRPAGCAAAAA